MKKIKLTISFFIIFVGFLIIGESFQFYLNNFEKNFYSTVMYLPDNSSQQEMINDLTQTAEKNNVELFIINNRIESTLLQYINIYGTSQVEEHLNKNYDIFEKKYNSLISGDTEVKFYDFDDIPNIENQNQYYLIGEANNIRKFKQQLINKYSGNFPRKGDNKPFENIYIVWIIICITIFIFTLYDIGFQKKENFIKITLGENIISVVLKNVLIDTISYIVIFIASILMLYNTTTVNYGISLSIKLYLILIIFNSTLYCSMFFYNLKEVLSSTKISRKVLSMTYILKLIVIILTIIIISSNMAIIGEGYKFYKQRVFFQEHKDYYFVDLGYKMKYNEDGTIEDNMDKSLILKQVFYDKFYYSFNAIELVNAEMIDDYEIILTNRNTSTYLKKNISEILNYDFTKSIYFIIPRSLRNSKTIKENLLDMMQFYEGKNFKDSYEFIYYEDNIEIICIDEMLVNGSELHKNPIIVYKNEFINITRDFQNITQDVLAKGTYQRDIMYKIDDKQFKQFIKEYNLENEKFSKTNVLEKYIYRWNIVKRGIYLSFVLSGLMFILEMFIIRAILMLEYEVNAIELSIKKVLGYSVFEKNRSIILITLLTTFCSIIIAIVVGSIYDITEFYYMITGGASIVTLELVAILYYINKFEKSNVQRILKGGNV